jgi:phosphohistidine phosphatase SixA
VRRGSPERPDVLLTGPLVHARATAEIVAAAFKKGGAAHLDLPDGPAAAGQLRSFVKPRILRSLGGA